MSTHDIYTNFRPYVCYFENILASFKEMPCWVGFDGLIFFLMIGATFHFLVWSIGALAWVPVFGGFSLLCAGHFSVPVSIPGFLLYHGCSLLKLFNVLMVCSLF